MQTIKADPLETKVQTSQQIQSSVIYLKSQNVSSCNKDRTKIVPYQSGLMLEMVDT